jgi:hypothetical protein
MTAIELKTQIHQAVENVPENVLQSVFDFLQQIQTQSSEKARRDAHFKRILSEDKELLNRLAK